jgi:hypothetical protein
MNWGVNFQVVHVHCLKLGPLTHNSLLSLTHIMVICVMFKEMEINMRKICGTLLFYSIREPFSYKYLHVLLWSHANPSSNALKCLSHH